MDDKQAVVSIYDHGFLYGMGLFETFRTYNGKTFLLDRHLRRLQAGCRELDIKYEPNLDQVNQAVQDLLKANRLTDAYFRWTVTAGTDMLGLPIGEYEKPNVIGYIKELPPVHSKLYESGKPLQRLNLPRNTPDSPVRLKSLHYMNCILGKRELNGYPWARQAEGLFLTPNGYITEGIVSNVFFVKQGVLFTPAVEIGILPGITRDFVIELASGLGYEVRQGFYTWADLLSAEEVFITNSIQEIVPVTELFETSGRRFSVGRGTVGGITGNIAKLYRQATFDANT